MGKTKKVGISGRYGSKYGAMLRKKWRLVMEGMVDKKNKCPRCETPGTVKRESTGIWSCKKCGAHFTGGAYAISTPRGEQSGRIAARKQRELEGIEL